MTRTHLLAYRLIEGLLTEDLETLHAVAQDIKREDAQERVLITVASLFAGSLQSAHGPVGALAVLDQNMANLSEFTA